MKLFIDKHAPFIIIFLALASPGMAQGTVSVSYEMAFPTSGFTDYIEENSFRGISIGSHFFFGDNLAAGIHAGWQVFDQQIAGDFSTEDADLFGTQSRFVNTFPLLLTGHYYLGGGAARPFIGAGLGLLRSLQRTEIGIFLVQDNDWHFALTPEVGVQLNANEVIGFRASVKYNYATQSDTFNYNYLAVAIGLTFSD